MDHILVCFLKQQYRFLEDNTNQWINQEHFLLKEIISVIESENLKNFNL